MMCLTGDYACYGGCYVSVGCGIGSSCYDSGGGDVIDAGASCGCGEIHYDFGDDHSLDCGYCAVSPPLERAPAPFPTQHLSLLRDQTTYGTHTLV